MTFAAKRLSREECPRRAQNDNGKHARLTARRSRYIHERWAHTESEKQIPRHLPALRHAGKFPRDDIHAHRIGVAGSKELRPRLCCQLPRVSAANRLLMAGSQNALATFRRRGRYRRSHTGFLGAASDNRDLSGLEAQSSTQAGVQITITECIFERSECWLTCAMAGRDVIHFVCIVQRRNYLRDFRVG